VDRVVPVRVEGGGLAGALAEMAGDWEQMHGSACVFEHEGDGGPDDEKRRPRCTGSLARRPRNAVIHGAAEHIVIRLAGREEGLEFEVRGDGKGMAVVPESGPRCRTSDHGASRRAGRRARDRVDAGERHGGPL
jgi:signal transduction histidine kinase